jgi:hypothetical protein
MKPEILNLATRLGINEALTAASGIFLIPKVFHAPAIAWFVFKADQPFEMINRQIYYRCRIIDQS